MQRTSGLADTLRKYGYLTQSIIQYYSSLDFRENRNSHGICPPFNEFIKRCQDLDKMTISDVFAIQLMQVLTLLYNSIHFSPVLHNLRTLFFIWLYYNLVYAHYSIAM